ncbi:shikimate dehydrogenase [Streptomyces sp. CBMA29]|uniref:shikimate dehydrogenase n=1 Tax=Streptomyces sp. CBMA29 TaxID=1896314 RepID=UPI0016620CCF|nr:shikimate dehydrogenase [Streptomyces sp. CBMA29]MBD0735154.1 shikimate dehydrogenase [Streptomyces sp. CBMA29]
MKSFTYGLIGSGIAASLSPVLHESEGAHHDIALSYVLIETDARTADLGQVIAHAEDSGYAGLNITHPFKQAVLSELDELSAEAAEIGAVNTVVLRDGRRIGHNTDVIGFSRSFRQGLPDVARHQVVQLGAGGAGAAVAQALLRADVVRLLLHDPDRDRAADLAAALERRFGAGRAASIGPDTLATAVPAADGLVNASAVGMAAHPGTPLDVTLLQPHHWVADVIYMPLRTRLLLEAAARGLPTLNGVGMCVFQAAEAFALITGLRPDVDRMSRQVAPYLRSSRAIEGGLPAG